MTNYDEKVISEPIELLARFLGTDKDDTVKATLSEAQRELLDEYSEILVYVDNQFNTYRDAIWKPIWDDKIGDWLRDEDGDILKHGLTKEDKMKIDHCKKRAIDILSAKLSSIVRTNRNDPKNHFANIFANYQNEEKNLKREEESTWEKVKKKLSGGADEDEDGE